MTPDFQEKYRAFANRYNLWHGSTVTTQQDLVGLFITRSVAKYLNDGGTFGFVTPLAVLSRQAYEGFRAGRWGTYLRGEFTETWDLNQMRPSGFFPVPSAVMFGIRHTFHDPTKINEEPACGFPPTKKVLSGLRVRNDWPATYEGLTITEAKNVELGTDADDCSPYNEVVVNGATITPRMVFMIEEQSQTTSPARQGTRNHHSGVLPHLAGKRAVEVPAILVGNPAQQVHLRRSPRLHACPLRPAGAVASCFAH